MAGDDLGIGLGWLGIYFTAFLTLWGGRTPGERLLGMRVVKLNGEPLGWWASYERIGGYAAGLATGLMGFAEIFRDPNRQAIHDKVTGTVVVRTRGAPYEAWKTRMASRSDTGPRGSGDAGYSGAGGPHAQPGRGPVTARHPDPFLRLRTVVGPRVRAGRLRAPIRERVPHLRE